MIQPPVILDAVSCVTPIVSGMMATWVLAGIVFDAHRRLMRHPIAQTVATSVILVLGIVGLFGITYFGRFVLVQVLTESPSFTTTVVCGAIVLIAVWSVAARLFLFFGKRPVGPILALSPGAVISLGIFGTFLGIYIGLTDFDTSAIDDSIPHLLEGLKTAFITSLFGMFFSLFLKYVYGLFARADSKRASVPSDDPTALLGRIATEISRLSVEIRTVNTTLLRCFQSDESFSVSTQMQRLRSDIGEARADIARLLQEYSGKSGSTSGREDG